MRVDRGEKQRAHHDADDAPEVTAGDTINKKAEDEFLGDRRERNRQNDDQDPLVQRRRFTEHFHDGLSLRPAAQEALRDDVRQKNQRIGSQDQNRSGYDRAKKTNFGKTACQIQIEPAQAKKSSEGQEHSNSEGAARDEIDAPHL